LTDFAVSLSHERSTAIAMVVAWGTETEVAADTRSSFSAEAFAQQRSPSTR
jgi:hypothetical protein